MRAGTASGALLPCLALAGLAALSWPTGAEGQDRLTGAGRRPGLGGRYTNRSITTARNSLYIIGGPWAPPLLGQRKDGVGYDGGIQLVQPDLDALAGLDGLAALGDREELIFNLNLGVGFGIYDHFEAGALFLAFEFTPDFGFGGFPVFLTYWWELGPVDVGARVVWFSFSDDPAGMGNRQTTLNPSVPVVIHLGTSRIDTGLFLPIGFREMPFNFRFRLRVAPGLSIPLRYAWNPIPELVLGLETGFYDDDMRQARDLSVPLGGMIGATLLAGDRLIDAGVVFQWDHFFRPNAPAGVDTLQPGFWRVSVGVAIKRLVL